MKRRRMEQEYSGAVWGWDNGKGDWLLCILLFVDVFITRVSFYIKYWRMQRGQVSR